MKQVDYMAVAEKAMAEIKKGVFLTVKAGEALNTMTIGWATIGYVWRKPIFMVAVRDSRHTFGIIEKAADFTVSVPMTDMKDAVMFCGTKSGRDYDKFKECSLELAASQKVISPSSKQRAFTLNVKSSLRRPWTRFIWTPNTNHFIRKKTTTPSTLVKSRRAMRLSKEGEYVHSLSVFEKALQRVYNHRFPGDKMAVTTVINGCRTTKIYCRPTARREEGPSLRTGCISAQGTRLEQEGTGHVRCVNPMTHSTCGRHFFSAIINSPLGIYVLASSETGIVCIKTEAQAPRYMALWESKGIDVHIDAERHLALGRQLDAYFERKLHRFKVLLDMRGTPFQREVWDLLWRIPFGKTRTYRDIAKALAVQTLRGPWGVQLGATRLPL